MLIRSLPLAPHTLTPSLPPAPHMLTPSLPLAPLTLIPNLPLCWAGSLAANFRKSEPTEMDRMTDG